MIVIEKVTELAVKAVNDNALSGLEQKIENKIAGALVFFIVFITPVVKRTR
jgi:hypothetical protein